jgi:hypothetical protein
LFSLLRKFHFCDILVSPSRVGNEPERTRAIREFPTPRDTKSISRFIGIVNFYHKSILRLAEVAAPLNALRKKSVMFMWGKEQQEAFEVLKQAISQPPVWRMADFSKFILQTVASDVALGVVLSQESDGVRQPIAYASRTLSARLRPLMSSNVWRCFRHG